MLDWGARSSAGGRPVGGPGSPKGPRLVLLTRTFHGLAGPPHGSIGVRSTDGIKYRAAGRIEAGIESYVSEVPLVADAKASTQAGFAIAKNIVSEADPRGHSTPTRGPELANWTLVRDKHLPASPLRVEAAPRTEIKVGVQIRIYIVLYAVMLIAHAIV